MKKIRKKLISYILLICLFVGIFMNTPIKINANQSFTVDGLDYKWQDEALWVKVFYHNSSTGEFFISEEETLNCNTPNKYSILNRLDEFKIGNTYEFLLEYPELGLSNRWTQTSNPTTTINRVEGYNPISISMNNYYWHGLARTSTSAHTFLDGSIYSDLWYYSIGSKATWSGANHMPSNAAAVTQVYLWQRVDGDYNLYDEYEKQVINWQTFVKVFAHDSSTGIYFDSKEQALNIQSVEKYSILNQLDKFYINNQFEFYLDYPRLGVANHWIQTSNPVTTTESVTGYSPISTTAADRIWNGLSLSNYAGTLIDGHSGASTWHYSIGCLYNYWPYTNTFPGPAGASTHPNYVVLYARVDNGQDIVEPIINRNTIDASNPINTHIEFNLHDNSGIKKCNIYKIGTGLIETKDFAYEMNTSWYLDAKENGLYVVEAIDGVGNMKRIYYLVDSINGTMPQIENVEYTKIEEDNLNINVSISSLEEFTKLEYYISDTPLTNEQLTNKQFIQSENLNLVLDKTNIGKYLYTKIYHQNGLVSEIKETHLYIDVNITFVNENDEIILETKIPYGDSVKDILPNVEKYGYSLSWDKDTDTGNIIDTTYKTIWTINNDYADYSIIIPKNLIVNNIGCEYVVKIKGLMGEFTKIIVTPDSEFILKDVSNIKPPVKCFVSLDKMEFLPQEINNCEEYISYGKISVEETLSAGMWYGIFNFKIETIITK